MKQGTRKFALGILGVVLLWVAGMFAPGVEAQEQVRHLVFGPAGSIVVIIGITVGGNVLEHFSKKPTA